MPTHLRVVSAFDDYRPGDEIVEPSLVDALIGRRDVVVPFSVPEPVPEPVPVEHGEG